jgi:hypothetical protein
MSEKSGSCPKKNGLMGARKMKRITFQSILFFFIVLLFAREAAAFKFDKWSSGMTVSQAIDIAERNDIPLNKDGIISNNKHFNPSTCRKYADTAREFYYTADILSKPATITLHFTPTSSRLYLVSIRWGNIPAKSPFIEELVEMLTRKYGVANDAGRDLFYWYRQWSIDSNNSSILKFRDQSTELRYIDNDLERAAASELKAPSQLSEISR